MTKKKHRSLTRTIGYLILANLIAYAFMSIIMVYGQAEFIDDYINENNVQARHDVVRNTTLNCMELNFTGGMPTYEDFTTWTELDVDNRLSQTVDRSIFTNLNRLDDMILLYKDVGVATPLKNWLHEFEFYVSSIDVSGIQYNRMSPISYGNQTNDFIFYSVNDLDWLGIILRSNNQANQYWLYGYEIDGVNEYESIFEALVKGNTYTFSTGVEYYFRFNKSGLSMDINVFSDSGRTTLIANCSRTLNDQHSVRYIMCPESLDYANGNFDTTGYIEYLWNGTSSGGYDLDGIFYTNEIISTINGSTLVLLYNATLDGGDLEVQFSPNNNTWGDHNNVTTGWDELILGFESIDLRDCNFTTLYMRFNFTRGGVLLTPRLYQIRVITSGSGIPSAGGISGYVVGTLLLLPASMVLLMAWKRRKRR